MHTVLIFFLLFQIPLFLPAQVSLTFGIPPTDSTRDVQRFQQKFEAWLAGTAKDSIRRDEANMVNNFVIFSEDGLIMKDLKFHSAESCKKQILDNLPGQKQEERGNLWMFVSQESHVNNSDLVEILQFLREQNIDYQFGREDDFVPKLLKE